MLPANALALIKEYSKPLTPPDWHTRSWLCVGNIYKEIGKYKITNPAKYYNNFKLYSLFRNNVQNQYTWWVIYMFYLKNGSKLTSTVFNINIKVLYDIISS